MEKLAFEQRSEVRKAASAVLGGWRSHRGAPSLSLSEPSVCSSREKRAPAEEGPGTSSSRNQGLLKNSNGNKQTVLKIR